jgi:hypothetical protein
LHLRPPFLDDWISSSASWASMMIFLPVWVMASLITPLFFMR